MRTQRNALACLSLLTLTLSTLAQSPGPSPVRSDWSRVQHLATGTAIRVLTKPPAPHTTFIPKSHIDCLFVSASDADLVCTRTDTVFFVPVHHTFHFAQPDIATLRLTHGDRSAFVGGAIGVGAGLGYTAIAGATTNNSESVFGYILLAILGGALGDGIGHATDFMGGPTIYRAP